MIRTGALVQVIRPNLRETGKHGVVTAFDESLGWYSVDLYGGPPFRGNYEEQELEVVKEQGDRL